MFLSRIRVCQYVSDICFCDELLQHEYLCNVNDGTAAGIKHLRRLQTGRLRRALGWARLPAGCCFHVPNLCDGIPGRFVILPLSVEGSLLRPEPSMIWTFSVEGSLLRPEPSMIWISSVEGSVILYRTFHDLDLQRGRFTPLTLNLP